MNWFERACQPGRVYVIAELGSNYHTDQHLFDAIGQAKALGADAIKYQYFTPDELYGPTDKKPTLPLAQLKSYADKVGIDFLCTAFSPAGMIEVDKFVDAHKIASSEMQHIRLLDLAKAFKKPVILSTGGHGLSDIKRTREYLGLHEMILMHCNLSYPSKFVDLEKLHGILEYFRCPWGFSDHTTSIDAIPFLMLNAGAYVYEKHFNPFELNDTPDAPHSLGFNEFRVFVKTLRREPVSYTEENEARLKHVRRIVATKDIAAGEVLLEGHNFGIYRSRRNDAYGSSPFAAPQIEGKRIKKDVFAFEGIYVGDCE